MVLENNKNNALEGFNDNTFPSEDPDAATPSSSASRIDSSSFPQPFSILGSLTGFSQSAVRFKTMIALQSSERKIGRVLEPDEAQAFALYLYKVEQTSSYWMAYGATLGACRCWGTAAQMRYPFYKPDLKKIDRNKFTIFRGTNAAIARHVWRLSLYALAAGHFGSVVGRIRGVWQAAEDIAHDPKLERLIKDLQLAQDKNASAPKNEGWMVMLRGKSSEGQAKNRSGGEISPQERWGKHQPKQDGGDDMSPTAGNEAWGSQDSATDPWATFSKDTSQPAPQKQQSARATYERNRRSQASPRSFEDEASPTGGFLPDEFSNPQSQSEQQSQPGESTWERLRRGGGPASTQILPPQHRRAETQRREQRDRSMMDESHTMDEGNEERKRTSSGDDKRW